MGKETFFQILMWVFYILILCTIIIQKGVIIVVNCLPLQWNKEEGIYIFNYINVLLYKLYNVIKIDAVVYLKKLQFRAPLERVKLESFFCLVKCQKCPSLQDQNTEGVET